MILQSKQCLLFLFVLISSGVFSQNVGINESNPTNALHVVPLSGEPLRIEGLTAVQTGDNSLLIVDPATGIVRYIGTQQFSDSVVNTIFTGNAFNDSIVSIIFNHGDTLLYNSTFVSALSDSIDTDVDSLVLIGNVLNVWENGTTASVDLSTLNLGAGADDWGTQVVVTGGTGLSGDGTTASPLTFTEVDGVVGNEYNTSFAINAGNLQITDGGGTISVPVTSLQDGTGTDSQNLTSSVASGNATVNISGGTGTTFSINDADSSPTNEHNTGMSVSGGNLIVTDGGGNVSVPLTSLQLPDTDWNINSNGTGLEAAAAGDNFASGDYALAAGEADTASGYGAVVSGGYGNVASGSTSTIGGGGYNTATVNSATVGGGWTNSATGTSSTVAGGQANIASANSATVAGGITNSATSSAATVGGGQLNVNSGSWSTISGGRQNVITGNHSALSGGQTNNVSGNYSVISGGLSNTASGLESSIVGGQNNSASGEGAFIGGGNNNISSNYYTVVTGGRDNIATEDYAVVSGGIDNSATAVWSSISGGRTNIASSDYAAIGGGRLGIASGSYSSISGGMGNATSGAYSSVSGGRYNTAQSYGEWVGGVYATVGSGNAVSFNATDRLFAVGNGTSSGARSNALTLYKNGVLEINEEYALPNSDGANNQVLTTNGAGVASWQTPAAGGSNNSAFAVSGTNLSVTDAGGTLNVPLATINGNDWHTNGNVGTASTFIGTTNAQPLIFRTQNSEKARIQSNGYMGIGVSAPVHKLEVEGPRTNTYGTTFRVANSASSGLAYQNGPAVLIETPNDSYGERRVSAVYFNRMRQNVEWCVGTEGGAFGSAPAYPAPSNEKFFISRTLKTGNAHQRVRPIYSNNTFFAINPDGTVGIGMTNPTYKLMLPNNAAVTGGQARAYAWTTYSDGRLKTDRTPLSYGLREVMEIEPLSYQHHNSVFLDANEDREKASIVISDSSSAQIGFIAQDLYKIIPEAVSPPADEETDLWAVDYTRLVPVLIKAVQEQQAEIESLKSQLEIESDNSDKIKNLENELNELKELILKNK